jgi:recombinational DNA repair ATPase RecF
VRLTHCRLESVRRHRQLELAFASGVTLVAGANESGKSTLVEAMHRALFLRANATGAPIQALRSQQHPGHPQVEIGFEAANQAWTLQKRFSGASGTASLRTAGQDVLQGGMRKIASPSYSVSRKVSAVARPTANCQAAGPISG